MSKIKSSSHSLRELNIGKASLLSEFIDEYQRSVRFFIDYLWSTKIKYNGKIFDLKQDLLDCPQFISTVGIDFQSNLSARALKSASTQACGIVKTSIDKRRRLLYIRSTHLAKKKRTRSLTKRINKCPLIKPILRSNFPIEISSLCATIETSHISYFDSIIILKSIGKRYGKIIVPIKQTKHSKRISEKGTLLKSILLSKNCVNLRYEYDPIESEGTKTIGADSGITSVLTLSDGQTTQSDIHGHSLNSILQKISRKKKGSKSFHKALVQRDNFIRWSINQLNLSDIKQINLEKVSNFRKGKNVGKFLNYSGEALIRSKLIDFAEDCGVRIVLQNSAYRSQRCSRCGYVCGSNRKAKLFRCKSCSFSADADFNASLNHEQNLPSANWIRYCSDLKKKFFWKEEGFFDLNGSELIVPDVKKNKVSHFI